MNGVRVDGLTEPGSYWRIDWFGYLSYEDGTQRWSQPLVQVYLSKLTDVPGKLNLKNIESSNYYDQRMVVLPVGYLLLLNIGDIWFNDVLYLSPSYTEKAFSNVAIDTISTWTITAGSRKPDSQHFFLDKDIFPYHYHSGCTKTYCEVVQLPYSTAALVIPHYVLLKAFFASHSSLFTHLLMYGLELGDLYNTEKSFIDEETGEAFIMLKTRMRNKSKRDIARIAFSDVAKYAVRRISNNFAIQKSSHQDAIISPKTMFPFIGYANFNMRGKWLKGKDDEWIFVVFNILFCDFPFPFKKLFYFRENPGDTTPERKNEHLKDKSDGKPGVRKRPRKSKELTLEPKEETDSNLDHLEIEAPIMTRLADLEDNIDTKVRLEEHKTPYRNQKLLQQDIDADTGNIDQGTATGENTPTEVDGIGVREESKEPKEKFKFSSKVCRISLFQESVESLALSSAKINLSWLELNHDRVNFEANVSYFPKINRSLSDNDRAGVKWVYINDMRRRIAIAEIVIKGNHHYFLEIERKCEQIGHHWEETSSFSIFHVVSETGEPIDENSIADFIVDTGKNNGNWAPSWREGYKYSALKHPKNQVLDDTPDIYVEKMASTLYNRLKVGV